ncbi:hypothetical protein [Microbacterium lacticum]
MPVLRIGLIGFGVASLAVALAPDAVVLVIARAAQGRPARSSCRVRSPS